MLSLFTFALRDADDDAMLAYVNAINEDGRIYVTQGRTGGRIVVRFQVGTFATTQADVRLAGAVLKAFAG